MHLIVVRRDTQNFQHLHPTMSTDGTWSTPLTLRNPGVYRVFADFKREGQNVTLASDLIVEGPAESDPIPPVAASSPTAGGYEVTIAGGSSAAGQESELEFEVTRGGLSVDVDPYLGARGHLVALRERDLAYLHVHPVEDEGGHETQSDAHAAGSPAPVAFATEFPSEGRYRLFLQFQVDGKVETASFTREVSR